MFYYTDLNQMLITSYSPYDNTRILMVTPKFSCQPYLRCKKRILTLRIVSVLKLDLNWIFSLLLVTPNGNSKSVKVCSSFLIETVAELVFPSDDGEKG